jgi:hypothetical protein
MRKIFITFLFAGLLLTANSVVWAQDKAPAKVVNTEKKAAVAKDATKACCAENKACCEAKAGEKKACCDAKAGDAKACCAEKKTCPAATAACTNKEATKETKSAGKK